MEKGLLKTVLPNIVSKSVLVGEEVDKCLSWEVLTLTLLLLIALTT